MNLTRLIFFLTVFMPLAGQNLQLLTVTTAGGYDPGVTVPGGVSIAFCTGIEGVMGVTQPDSLPLPSEFLGVRVLVNGVSAPLLAIAPSGPYQQVNFQVPILPEFTRSPIEVTVIQNGRAATMRVGDAAPSPDALPFAGYPADLFRDGNGYGLFQHADYSPVTLSNPARPGETIIVYATGMGAVEFPVPAGHAAPSQQPSPLVLYPGESGLKVFLCSPNSRCAPTEAAFQIPAIFAGLSPGSVGLYQINFRIPEDAVSGDLEFGVIRTYCYRGPCTLISPFQQNFESKRVRIPVLR